MQKIGFGGSCHWCTEAIFSSLRGVSSVEQGWISSSSENHQPSEAVIVHFKEEEITLKVLIAIHLHTHSCNAQHAMRSKYRSAVYSFTDKQKNNAEAAIRELQFDFALPIITKVLPLITFKLNKEQYLNYYYKDPSKPFCKNVVTPKLKELMRRFAIHVSPESARHLAIL